VHLRRHLRLDQSVQLPIIMRLGGVLILPELAAFNRRVQSRMLLDSGDLRGCHIFLVDSAAIARPNIRLLFFLVADVRLEKVYKRFLVVVYFETLFNRLLRRGVELLMLV
jgi:hypothetical protein